MNDKLREALRSAPPDDEPVTAEEIAAVEEGLADIAAGRYSTRTDEEFLAEIMADAEDGD